MRLCFWIAWLVLLAVGILKILDFNGAISSLDLPDPVFNIKQRSVFLGAGYAEAIVCCATLFARKDVVRVNFLVWVSAMFMRYRFGSYLLGSTESCLCAGHTIGQIVPDIVQHQAEISFGLFLFLLPGSYILLGAHLVKFKRRTKNLSHFAILRKSPEAGKV